MSKISQSFSTFKKSFIFIGLVVLLQLTLSHHATAQTTIYYQNFGTAITSTLPAGWTASGAAASNITLNTASSSSGYTLSTGTAASGSGNLADGAVSAVTGTATVIVSGVINTVGFSGITVQYAARATATYTAVPAFQWSSDGITWNTIAYTAIPATSTWTLVNSTPIALPSGAAGQSNLHFMWTFTRAATSGNYRIDDFTVTGTAALTNYYSFSGGNLDATTTWGTNTDGTGTHPSNFTNNAQIFHISNGNPGILGSNWTVSGTGSKIIVDGTDFAVPSAQSVTATIDVNAGRTLTLQNPALPVLGILDPASTVKYSGINFTGTFVVPSASTYGNLIFDNSAVVNTATTQTITFAGNFTLQNSSSFIGSDVSANGYNLTTTGTANQTISANGLLCR